MLVQPLINNVSAAETIICFFSIIYLFPSKMLSTICYDDLLQPFVSPISVASLTALIVEAIQSLRQSSDTGPKEIEASYQRFCPNGFAKVIQQAICQ
jgi:hypothetical protein